MKQPLKAYKTENNDYYLEGDAIIFKSPDNNGRIILKKEVRKQIKRLQAKVDKGMLCGELGQGSAFDISMNNVSHVIEKIDLLKDSMYVKFKILDTPCGRNVKKFIDDEVPLYSAYRMDGSVEEGNVVKINKLFTFDVTPNLNVEFPILTIDN